ncbi:MAG: MBL fold metallo-hydrolase [Desulfurococcales archaeon]|nr:MBL fold metallo-hydrolase [Desulfurococcales archaeon]
MVKMQLKVLGGGHEVGRAAIAVGSKGRYILMDYGVNFSEEDIPQLPDHIKPSELEAVAITHAHLDHIGAAPFLYTTAQLPILMTSITKELGKLMIQDFLKLSGYYLPFEQVDLEVMLDNVVDVTYGKQYEFGDFKIQFINAGHIPGSGMIYVDVDGVKVLYTGDVNTVDTRLVKGAVLTGVRADVLVIEGTYGNSTHPPRDVIEKEFIESVKEVVENGGNVLVPSFSLGRSQEIMSLLAERCDDAHVFFDGMVRVITELMVSHPEFIHKYDLLTKAVEEFKAVRNSGDRRRIVKGKGNIIVSSAGMLKGGPAQYYIKKLGGNPKNAVFMVSYQAPNTPGRKLLETGKLGDEGSPTIKARLQWFDFSSHAGVDGLMELASSVTGLKKIVVVHSDENVGSAFKERLGDIVGEENVFFPTNGEVLTFDL